MKFYLISNPLFTSIVSAPDEPTARLLLSTDYRHNVEDRGKFFDADFLEIMPIGIADPAISRVWSWETSDER